LQFKKIGRAFVTRVGVSLVNRLEGRGLWAKLPVLFPPPPPALGNRGGAALVGARGLAAWEHGDGPE